MQRSAANVQRLREDLLGFMGVVLKVLAEGHSVDREWEPHHAVEAHFVSIEGIELGWIHGAGRNV